MRDGRNVYCPSRGTESMECRNWRFEAAVAKRRWFLAAAQWRRSRTAPLSGVAAVISPPNGSGVAFYARLCIITLANDGGKRIPPVPHNQGSSIHPVWGRVSRTGGEGGPTHPPPNPMYGDFLASV